jgi:hypothetical protein
MKFRLGLFLIAFICFLQKSAFAQCDDSTARVISYDSTVIGSSNDYYTFTFPKFDATVGTLVDVTFTSKVTLNFAFTLENKESSNINYRVRLIRDHEISGNALMNPLTDSKTINYGPFSLGPNDGVTGSGPDFITRDSLKPLNNYLVSQSVANTADYMGTDSLNFDYMSSAASFAIGSLNNTYTSIAQDTLNLKISYRFCPTSQLASDIQQVIAYEKNDLTYIKWNVVNEPSGRKYYVQKNNSAKGFQTIAIIEGDQNRKGQYEYTFNSSPEKGKAQYRIVAENRQGDRSFSRIRLIDYGGEENTTGIKLYPNPSQGATQLLFHNTQRGDYDVQVLNASGQLVKNYQFKNALQGRINEQQELRKGIYFIRSIDKKSGLQMVGRLVIH